MKAARLLENNQPLKLMELPTPTITNNEVLVKISAAGVCHSDLHLWRGAYDLGGGNMMDLKKRGVPLPLTPGHEISGFVSAVGDLVQYVKKDEPVIIYPWVGCGYCNACIQGNDELCDKPRSLGIYQDGGYAEYVKVPHEKFLINADGLDLTSACTLSCSALTAFSAIKKAHASSLTTLAIIGIGGLGSIGIQLAKLLTHATVIALDISNEKSALAREMGADEFIVLNDKTKDSIMNLTNGQGLDTIVDFVGAENTVSVALDVLKKSGHLIIVGLVGGQFTYPIPFIPMKNLKIEGSYTGNCYELRELVALAKRKLIIPYISQTYGLSQATEALMELKDQKVLGRSVLKP